MPWQCCEHIHCPGCDSVTDCFTTSSAMVFCPGSGLLTGACGTSAASITLMLLVLSSPEIPVSFVRCISASKICRLLAASRWSEP